MMKKLDMNYPTYMELDLNQGEIESINGKELNKEGVNNVINYLCENANVKSETVMHVLSNLKEKNGAVTLKLFEGSVIAV